MTEEELQTRVIENIRSIRKKAGLSQERLADKADISRQMMNDIEGRRRWLTKNSLVKISNALNVDVSELFTPIQDENDNIKTFYDAITKKIKEQVKIALNNALETI
ncbi:helix-turn-helix transcriptional regulator [uncultured Treponema sp.]|uniref:helix-turn-helix domain-containing protein n=1 Tax=uncultured Treponema sp. TaxID=162155 RepID=UPI0025D8C5FA|nr:helix-turn-helix transcriptional regulator [uncultured Treponema sp.]